MPEFVIVGGGVYGCAVAWELAKRGAEVHLLEANEIAGGASGGLGKRGVRANGRDIRELPLMELGYDIWPSLHEQLEAPTGYERAGHLLLIEREKDYAGAAAQRWMQEQQGIPTRMVEQNELREMEPHVSDRIMAALYCPKDGIADHTATTRGFAQAAIKLGAQIQEQTAVIGLERQGERVSAVITQDETRVPVGRAVLLLSNTHVPAFVQEHLGLMLPLWPLLPQVMLTEPLNAMPLNHLIGHAHRTLAMKSVPGNQIMISGGWLGHRNPQSGQNETSPDQVEGNRAEAVAVYPDLAGIGITAADASRPELVSIDGIPIIDCLPGAENMIVASGWSGHGWAIAPAISQLLAEWAYSGQRSELLHPFGYDRFGKLT
jgi:sarcosine oxidase subunit beta